MTPRVISQDLYASVVTVANANAAAYAAAATGHQDVAGQWMGRAANLPETNAGAAVDAAAGQAQRQAVAHQNESDALAASADYHRQAQALGNEMNGQLDRLDRRAQNLLDGSPASWHGTIRALANAAGRALGDLYGMRLWQAQEAAGSVITPLHDAIGGLSRPPAGGAAPSPVGKGSPPVSASQGPLQAASMPAQAVPDTATASAAAPAAASQPDRPELVPVAVGVGVPVPAQNGGGESANLKNLQVSPPDDDDDDDGGGGTIASIPAGGGAGGRAGSDKPRESRGLGKSPDSDNLAKTGSDQHPPAPAAPSMASPVASTTPLAAAPAAADRKRAKAQPKIGARSHEPK